MFRPEHAIIGPTFGFISTQTYNNGSNPGVYFNSIIHARVTKKISFYITQPNGLTLVPSTHKYSENTHINYLTCNTCRFGLVNLEIMSVKNDFLWKII